MVVASPSRQLNDSLSDASFAEFRIASLAEPGALQVRGAAPQTEPPVGVEVAVGVAVLVAATVAVGVGVGVAVAIVNASDS